MKDAEKALKILEMGKDYDERIKKKLGKDSRHAQFLCVKNKRGPTKKIGHSLPTIWLPSGRSFWLGV